jgi:hypothetical protein
METGIVAKRKVRGSIKYDEHAKRYVFYPLSNLALPAPTPIWGTKILRGRIHLLESFEYRSRGDDPEYEVQMVRSGDTPLILKTMGTDAQLSYLMGNSDGVGWMERGMVHLESIIDVDPETVVEVEKLLLSNEQGDIEVPADLVEFEQKLAQPFSGDNPVSQLAEAVRLEMLKGVMTAKNYCEMQTIILEKELNEGRSGRMGIKSLDMVQQYYFKQIRKPLPDERTGVNTGNELAKALAPLIQAATGQSLPVGGVPVGANAETDFAKEIELQEMRKKLADQEATIKEQESTIKELAEVEND